MFVHETGHAVSAWLCGYWSTPGLWFTPVADEREFSVTLFFILALLSIWFPCRAYAEWYLNFTDVSWINTYQAAWVLVILLAVGCVILAIKMVPGAEKEKAELAVLKAYLPEELSPAQVEEIIVATIAEVGATTKADMGKVMKAAQAKLAGRADNRPGSTDHCANACADNGAGCGDFGACTDGEHGPTADHAATA